MSDEFDMPSGTIKDFPVVESKSLVEMKLNALRQEAKKKAQGVAKEEIVEMPPDIDVNRLAKIAKELNETPEPTDWTAKEVQEIKKGQETKLGYAKAKVEEHKEMFEEKLPLKTKSLSSEGINGLVLSVTTVVFKPSRDENLDLTQKYHILIETTIPLQLGKEYQITSFNY